MKKPYLNPYLAGAGIGLSLLASIFFFGQGLGASGTLMRGVTWVAKLLFPGHVEGNAYLAQLGGGGRDPLLNYLVFLFVGVVVGGFVSGLVSGRLKREINHGPRITPSQRIAFAMIGGFLFALGSRFARGCTSGVALSGGATLALGSWITMLVLFIVAYVAAFIFRKLWI
ncbi:MAG: YeeE/YedE family protein [Oligoflexia bacterium]|nr:YeeE/YedE family protein [Oligoflexia bacterium]